MRDPLRVSCGLSLHARTFFQAEVLIWRQTCEDNKHTGGPQEDEHTMSAVRLFSFYKRQEQLIIPPAHSNVTQGNRLLVRRTTPSGSAHVCSAHIPRLLTLSLKSPGARLPLLGDDKVVRLILAGGNKNDDHYEHPKSQATVIRR
jgi:hypothetical protein